MPSFGTFTGGSKHCNLTEVQVEDAGHKQPASGATSRKSAQSLQ